MLLGKKHRTNVDSAQPRAQLSTPSSAEAVLLVSAEGDLWARELPSVRLAGRRKELTPLGLHFQPNRGQSLQIPQIPRLPAGQF